MLANLVDTYISEKRNTNDSGNDKFRVSDAGRCHLMRYWKRQGKPASDDFDERTLRVFEVGHVFHVWLQDLLIEKGILVGKEFEVEDIHRRGHIDALIQTESGLLLYDFKTVHSRKFTYLTDESDRHYHMQAASYTLMLPFGVAETRIAYISKDDLRILELPVDVEEIKDAVTADWYTLVSAWANQKEPTPNPQDWECRYCTYRASCEHAIRPEEKPKRRTGKKTLLAEPIEQALEPFAVCREGGGL
jgi:CRISPR/Cas system-associated exonuclease Cas4 (RecB family)